MIDITLNKEKYRNPNHRTYLSLKNCPQPEGGTRVYEGGRFKPNPGQAGNGRAGSFGATFKKKNKKGSVRPPRRAYGPW